MSIASQAELQGFATDGLFKARRLGHINKYVADAEEAYAFYHDIVGYEEVYRRPGVDGIFLSNGNTYHDVALMGDRQSHRPPGLNHLAFELESEVDLVRGYELALKSGVEFDMTASHNVAHSVYLRDPDGNGVEIYADVDFDWREHRAGVIDVVEPPWSPGSTEPVAESRYPVAPEIRAVEGAVFHPVRASSAVFVADRFDEMLAFYTGVVGLSLIGEPTSPFVVLAGTVGRPTVSLFRVAPGRSPGLHHVSFEVADPAELVASRAALEERGISPTMEWHGDGRRAVVIEDPVGMRLQFFSDTAPLASWIGKVSADEALFLL